jgi:hypothetical protein
MRKSFVTWRVSLSSTPTPDELHEVEELLAPIARTERPTDAGAVFREHGLSEHLFVEPEIERTAGEIAMSCLTKAHRLGVGWSVMWPGFHPSSGGGWPAEEVERAARPECLDGLVAMLPTSGVSRKTLHPNLEAASFQVTVIEQSRQTAVTAGPTGPAELAPPATGATAVRLLTSLLDLLIRYRAVPWAWELACATQQLEGFGYQLEPEGADELEFTAPGAPKARIRADGSQVRTIEFSLVEHHDPHLLGETALDEKRLEFERLFSTAVNGSRSLLGQPLFAGGAGEAGFPTEQWAELAAVWITEDHRILLEVQHNDKELPIELCLVFAP